MLKLSFSLWSLPFTINQTPLVLRRRSCVAAPSSSLPFPPLRGTEKRKKKKKSILILVILGLSGVYTLQSPLCSSCLFRVLLHRVVCGCTGGVLERGRQKERGRKREGRERILELVYLTMHGLPWTACEKRRAKREEVSPRAVDQSRNFLQNLLCPFRGKVGQYSARCVFLSISP